LISLDHEHLTRLGSIVMVRTPAVVLAELIPPTSPSSTVCPIDLFIFADYKGMAGS
jgi:hypothetical protein